MQRYDPDPAAKAAAATVLASKLGADSGLKVYVGDEDKLNSATRMSNDVEFVQASGLRNRKPGHTRSSSAGSSPVLHRDEGMLCSAQSESLQTAQEKPLVVEHQNPQGSALQEGGWIARLAALLVGEDPTESYALICGNCHMHNGKWTHFNLSTRVRMDTVPSHYDLLFAASPVHFGEQDMHQCMYIHLPLQLLCSLMKFMACCFAQDLSGRRIFHTLLTTVHIVVP